MGCASPKWQGSHTAADQFSSLSNGQKAVAKNFYNLGQGDAMMRWYFGERAKQANGLSSEASGPKLQRKYVVLPVPEHADPDGTVKEASNQVVEVVQFVAAVPQPRGRTLFIVK